MAHFNCSICEGPTVSLEILPSIDGRSGLSLLCKEIGDANVCVFVCYFYYLVWLYRSIDVEARDIHPFCFVSFCYFTLVCFPCSVVPYLEYAVNAFHGCKLMLKQQ
jgi:hypothetical protein